jgi:hypothetical protein
VCLKQISIFFKKLINEGEKMKKVMIWVLCVLFALTLFSVGVGCAGKTETTAKGAAFKVGLD